MYIDELLNNIVISIIILENINRGTSFEYYKSNPIEIGIEYYIIIL